MKIYTTHEVETKEVEEFMANNLSLFRKQKASSSGQSKGTTERLGTCYEMRALGKDQSG